MVGMLLQVEMVELGFAVPQPADRALEIFREC
jgi:hypothetical protein